MDLDDLKRSWQEQDRALTASLRVNRDGLQHGVLGKARTALKRLTFLLVAGVLTNLAIALGLGSFVAAHVAEARFLIPGAGLLLGVAALLFCGIRQLAALGQIDFSAPVVVIQKRLESLRVERIREFKWTLLLSPLVWIPMLIVAFEGFFNVDVYAILPAAWLVANVAFGALLIPLVLWLCRRFAARLDASPLARRVARDLAGYNLNAATRFLAAIEDFEKEETPA